jgi:magnesium-transporting ATPase (P-type)
LGLLHREFFLHLSLNHDVMPEGDIEEKLVYSASSPDESALVYAAKVCMSSPV